MDLDGLNAPLPGAGMEMMMADILADLDDAHIRRARELDAKAQNIADQVDANSLERETILKISRIVRHGCKTMDLTFRKDGRDYRFEADWVARLFR